MSWYRYEMSQGGYSSYAGKPDVTTVSTQKSKPILKTKPVADVNKQDRPLTVNINSSYCYIEQQVKESLDRIIKDMQTKHKLEHLFVTYQKKKKHVKSKLIKY